ncbi:unnamed protein product [Paramecium octaurelia]|uniref:Uncharacterized protein n=1 Tax=Paramecium octaurelia TaxID=43137 RepID=A0A8S1WQI6_PAROT|nr:unnamed protein product [Paramecium octaurelia]
MKGYFETSSRNYIDLQIKQEISCNQFVKLVNFNAIFVNQFHYLYLLNNALECNDYVLDQYYKNVTFNVKNAKTVQLIQFVWFLFISLYKVIKCKFHSVNVWTVIMMIFKVQIA